MSTERELKALFSDVMDRMTVAGWLKSYTFTVGKGFHLVWSETGCFAALDLKGYAHALGLLDDEARVVLANKLAHGLALGGASDVHLIPALARYQACGFLGRIEFLHEKGWVLEWTEPGEAFRRRLAALLDSLHIAADDEDRAFAVFHIADEWAPGKDTPVRLGP